MMDVTVFDVALVPLVMALVEMAKAIGMPARFAPLLALALGVALGVGVVAPNNIVQGIVVGAAIGATAVGLYSGTKNTVGR